MAINPLQFFNVGQQIGAVNSPASGPGQLIRNVLQQAQKKGLLQAQSEAQLGTAKGLHQFKVDNPIGPQTKPVKTLVQDGQGGFVLQDIGEVPSNTAFPRTPTVEDPATIELRRKILDQFGGNAPQSSVTPNINASVIPLGGRPSEEEAQAAQKRGAVGYDPSIGQWVDANGQPI